MPTSPAYQSLIQAVELKDEGILLEGDSPLKGVSVARKGEGVRFEAYQWQPVIDLIGVVTSTMVIATALALTNVLWRSAWARLRKLVILRTVGFPILSLVSYLLVHAMGVILLGILLGGGIGNRQPGMDWPRDAGQ